MTKEEVVVTIRGGGGNGGGGGGKGGGGDGPTPMPRESKRCDRSAAEKKFNGALTNGQTP